MGSWWYYRVVQTISLRKGREEGQAAPAKSRRPPLLFFMITGYFGLPGCGKSTFLAKLAQGYIRSGYRVFCLDSAPVDGCHLISFDDLGRYDMSCSVILLDEVSLFADNRDYKRFSDVVKQFMILHRHYHCDIVWFTQQFDGVDRKIRGAYYLSLLCSISWYV